MCSVCSNVLCGYSCVCVYSVCGNFICGYSCMFVCTVCAIILCANNKGKYYLETQFAMWLNCSYFSTFYKTNYKLTACLHKQTANNFQNSFAVVSPLSQAQTQNTYRHFNTVLWAKLRLSGHGTVSFVSAVSALSAERKHFVFTNQYTTQHTKLYAVRLTKTYSKHQTACRTVLLGKPKAPKPVS